MTAGAFRHHRVAMLGLGILCGVVAILATTSPYVPIDTQKLVAGAFRLPGCVLSGGDGCRARSGFPPLGPYPLLQYLFAVPFRLIGLSQGAAIRFLGLVSACAFALTIAVSVRVAQRRAAPGWGRLIAGVIITGPLLWYAHATFGEMLATTAIVVAVAAALLRASPAMVFLTTWAAGLVKETAPPFVVLIVGCAIFVSFDRDRRRAAWFALLAGAAAAVTTGAAFNLLRFGTVLNTYYLSPSFRVPGLSRKLNFALAMWVSPNAGVLFFWLSGILLLTLLLAMCLRNPGIRTKPSRSMLAALVLIATLVAMTGGFAAYYDPFGWVSWGPRFLIPWILPVLLTAICALPQAGMRIPRVVGRHLRVVAAGLAVLASVPTLGAVVSEGPVGVLFMTTDATCPRIPVWPVVPLKYFYHCMEHFAWGKAPGPLESGFGAVFSRPGLLLLMAELLALTGLLIGRPRVAGGVSFRHRGDR